MSARITIRTVADYSRLLVAERTRHDTALTDINAAFERFQARCAHKDRQVVCGVWLCKRCGVAMGKP